MCDVGIKVCFGGIVGLGEIVCDCVGLLVELVNLLKLLESVLINMLVKVKGILLENNDDVDVFEFICIIVVVCIMMLIFYV